MSIKYVVECHENRIDPHNKTAILRSVPLVSSLFNHYSEAAKFIKTWNHMFNVRQGRCVEFRTYNSRAHPAKFVYSLSEEIRKNEEDGE